MGGGVGLLSRGGLFEQNRPFYGDQREVKIRG